MPTVYVTSSPGSAWHILRRNERDIVWCPARPEAAEWPHSSLRTPALVCAACRDREDANRAADVGRVPGLGSVF
jgi:hypothetical protein